MFPIKKEENDFEEDSIEGYNQLEKAKAINHKISQKVSLLVRHAVF